MQKFGLMQIFPENKHLRACSACFPRAQRALFLISALERSSEDTIHRSVTSGANHSILVDPDGEQHCFINHQSQLSNWGVSRQGRDPGLYNISVPTRLPSRGNLHKTYPENQSRKMCARQACIYQR